MEPPSTPSTRPEVQILSNEAALFSLKRPQLLALAREHGVRGVGKNFELIQRLQDRGRELAAIPQIGDDSLLDADESNASWAVLREGAMPAQEELAEFGVQDTGSANSSRRSKASISASSSSSSIASTIRSAGTSILRALVDPISSNKSTPSSSVEQPDFASHVPSIHPTLPHSLVQVEPAEPEEPVQPALSSDAETDYDNGGIRLVSSRSTIHSDTADAMEEDDAPPVPAIPPSAAALPAFIFGSPVQSPASPPPSFSFAMPGSLFASTTSTTVDDADETSGNAGKTAAELVMEEMNRRAAEARAAAGGSSSFAASALTLGGSRSGIDSPSKGSKEAFDLSHKRAFAQMDSIVHHYAAKRPHPSTSASSTNLASLARSASSRALASSSTVLTDERSAKRLKPSTSKPSGLNRLPSSSSSKKLVDGLRAAGWSAAPAPSTSVSLASSLRAGPSSGVDGKGKGKEKTVREDLKPVQEREKEARKRQLELAKARRKSQAVVGGSGLGRRRPGLNVGPKPSGSTASRFLKSTFKKFAPSIGSSTASSSTAAPSTSKPLSRSTSIPRFASSTASTSSRTAGASASPVTSLKKQPGWKKFDLQESLKRPMAWKPQLGGVGGSSLSGKPTPTATASGSLSTRPSPAFAAPSSATKRTSTLTRQPSARVANPGLLGAVKAGAGGASSATSVAAQPIAEEPASAPAPSLPSPADDPLNIAAKLAALPSAPSTVFGSSASTSTPLQPLTNAPLPSASASTSAAPAAGKKRFPPSTSAAASGRKTASSATRLARGGEKAKGRAQIDGLESRARKVQAKAGAAKGWK
ncbi:hypothetical protein JCM6882_007423 [Rhodosporidiobolus microsporus]